MAIFIRGGGYGGPAKERTNLPNPAAEHPRVPVARLMSPRGAIHNPLRPRVPPLAETLRPLRGERQEIEGCCDRDFERAEDPAAQLGADGLAFGP